MSNSFFSDFLYLTDIKTVLFIAILIGLFFVMNLLQKKKVSFSKRMIFATLIGLGLGLIIQLVGGFPEAPMEVPFINEINKWYGLVAYGFMDLLKMLVVPLVFVSIIRVIINMQDSANLGRLTGKTLGTLIGTTAIAAVVGILVANLFKL
ncbi:MAG: cation:dicarboxylate symporter family transporter, partial [Turicibacter sp.]